MCKITDSYQHSPLNRKPIPYAMPKLRVCRAAARQDWWVRKYRPEYSGSPGFKGERSAVTS